MVWNCRTPKVTSNTRQTPWHPPRGGRTAWRGIQSELCFHSFSVPKVSVLSEMFSVQQVESPLVLYRKYTLKQTCSTAAATLTHTHTKKNTSHANLYEQEHPSVRKKHTTERSFGFSSFRLRHTATVTTSAFFVFFSWHVGTQVDIHDSFQDCTTGITAAAAATTTTSKGNVQNSRHRTSFPS